MIDYADFVSRLNAKVKSDEDFYVELLKTVIKSPHRYTGIFRLTNAKTKLIFTRESCEVLLLVKSFLVWYLSALNI